MKNYLLRHRKVAGLLGASAALVLAVIYGAFVPEGANDGSVRGVVLAYAHSVCWFLLGLASVLWSAHSTGWPTRLAYSALAVYVVFIASIVLG